MCSQGLKATPVCHMTGRDAQVVAPSFSVFCSLSVRVCVTSNQVSRRVASPGRRSCLNPGQSIIASKHTTLLGQSHSPPSSLKVDLPTLGTQHGPPFVSLLLQSTEKPTQIHAPTVQLHLCQPVHLERSDLFLLSISILSNKDDDTTCSTSRYSLLRLTLFPFVHQPIPISQPSLLVYNTCLSIPSIICKAIISTTHGIDHLSHWTKSNRKDQSGRNSP